MIKMHEGCDWKRVEEEKDEENERKRRGNPVQETVFLDIVFGRCC